MDPRVRVSAADLSQQFESSVKVAELQRQLEPIGKRYEAVVRQLEKLSGSTTDQNVAEKLAVLRKKLEMFAEPAAVRAGRPLGFDLLNKVKKLFHDLQQVEAAPTSQQLTAAGELARTAQSAIKNWEAVPAEVATLNAQLTAAGLPPVKLP
jgi:hypothetical protein